MPGPASAPRSCVLGDHPVAEHVTAEALRSATLLLAAAAALNIKVGTDGVDVITVSTRVPLAVIRWIEDELVKNKPAVIAVIQRENAGRL